jgi:hypothetical protein
VAAAVGYSNWDESGPTLKRCRREFRVAAARQADPFPRSSRCQGGSRDMLRGSIVANESGRPNSGTLIQSTNQRINPRPQCTPMRLTAAYPLLTEVKVTRRWEVGKCFPAVAPPIYWIGNPDVFRLGPLFDGYGYCTPMRQKSKNLPYRLLRYLVPTTFNGWMRPPLA